jgi:hypothetical protein
MKKYTLGSSKEEVLRMIPDRVIKKIILGDRSVGIVRVGEIFTCFEEFCPHRGASLIQGTLWVFFSGYRRPLGMCMCFSLDPKLRHSDGNSVLTLAVMYAEDSNEKSCMRCP